MYAPKVTVGLHGVHVAATITTRQCMSVKAETGECSSPVTEVMVVT
jgi:hypothetical protein